MTSKAPRVVAFTTALAHDPQMEAAYYNRGNSYIALERNDRAIRDYNQSLRLSPNDPVTLRAKARVYGLMGDNLRAVEELNLAIQHDPRNAELYSERSEAYLELGNKAAADADQGMTLKLDPEVER